MKLLTISMLSTLAVACHSSEPKEPMVGGPCTYTTTRHPAKLIGLSFDNPTVRDLLFEVKLGNLIDTLSFHEVNGYYLTDEEAQLDVLNVGTTLTLAEDQITSGACTPTIRRLELKPFGQ